MKRLLTLTLLSAALALGGCQTVLKDLQGCERHYDGTVSGGTIQPAVLAGSAKIDCCPVGTYGVNSGTPSARCEPLPPGTPLPPTQ